MSNKKENKFQVGDCVLDTKHNKRFTVVNDSVIFEIEDSTGQKISLSSKDNFIKMMTEDDIQFAYESITEIIDFAKKAVHIQKDTTKDGIYGVSLTILIACAFDAMGRIGLDKDNKNSDGNKERFKFIQNKYINGQYGFANDGDFVDVFYEKYRCGLVHSGSIVCNHILSIDSNINNVLVHDSGTTTINVPALIDMAEKVFEQLCNEYQLQYDEFKFVNKPNTGKTQTTINKVTNMK